MRGAVPVKEEKVLTRPATTKRPANRKAPVAVPALSKKSSVRAMSGPAAVPAHVPVREPEAEHALIAELAYYRAERRGFTPGGELEDWLEAEAEVRGRFMA